MKYELGFLEEALKEWGKLDANTREQFKSKLTERLANPRVLQSKLRGHKDRCKIKLRSVGDRLLYEVRDSEVIVVVWLWVSPSGQWLGKVYSTRHRVDTELPSRSKYGRHPQAGHILAACQN